jgi:hypothetical protein
MPLARIITRIPENAASLAEYLSQQGYSVEMVTPGEPQDSFADVEITFDTCRSDQALERAAKLASGLDADVMVAPGAVPETTPQPEVVEPPVVATVEAEPAGPSWFEEHSQVIRATMGDWRARSREVAAAANHRLSGEGRALLHKGLNASRQGGAKAGKWSHKAGVAILQAVVTAATSLRASIQRAWSHAAERIRTRTLEAQQRRESRRQEHERRMQEIATLRRQREEAAAQLEAEKLRAQQERAAIPSEPADTVSSELEELVPHPVAPIVLRPVERRHSPLMAYTRNRGRDWKMAFVGAAVASAAIMLVSFSVQHKPLPQNDSQQKMPFGTAAAQPPQTPALMIPATNAKVPVPPPSLHVAAKQTAAAPKPKVAPAPETQVVNDDEYFDEVVVQHYPTHQSAKARTGDDGVKRISDLE